jgi:hypothetical protein
MKLVSFLLFFVFTFLQKGSCQFRYRDDGSLPLEHRKNSNYFDQLQVVENLGQPELKNKLNKEYEQLQQVVENQGQPENTYKKSRLDQEIKQLQQVVENLAQPEPTNTKNRLDKEYEQLQQVVENQGQLDPEGKYNQYESSNSFIPTRSKKLKYEPEPLTCAQKFKQESNVIVDSKSSTKNGAELLYPVRYIEQGTAKKGLNALQDSCMNLCCQEDGCDTALLSMTLGTVRIFKNS